MNCVWWTGCNEYFILFSQNFGKSQYLIWSSMVGVLISTQICSQISFASLHIKCFSRCEIKWRCLFTSSIALPIICIHLYMWYTDVKIYDIVTPTADPPPLSFIILTSLIPFEVTSSSFSNIHSYKNMLQEYSYVGLNSHWKRHGAGSGVVVMEISAVLTFYELDYIDVVAFGNQCSVHL